MVIALDDEETVDPVLSLLAPAFARTSGTVSTVIEPSDTPAEPDIEPDHERLKSVKNVVVIKKNMGNSRKERGDNVELKATTTSGENNAGVVDELTPEEATCTACSTVIGQLDVLQQQVHLNECIGGRVTITTANVAAPFTASTVKNDAKTKTRKRGNGGSGVTRTKKPRKPKTYDNNDSIAAVPKTKRTRKRKRVDTGGDIVLALALTGASKIDKEQQTDLQLAGTKKKIEELDEQMAKLAKRRVNLVKTQSRLEKTKEKLRKSQVLPPAKVLKLLDLKAALNVIFPNNRQVHPWNQRVYTKQTERSSVVAMRYMPLRWSESSKNVDCDESKHAELAAVAAISMWKRASQQLFGLQRDSLLYRNSVLRAFLGGDENAECGGIDMDGSVDMENSHNVDNEDTDTNFEREAEYEGKSELVPVLSDYTIDWTRTYSEVPDVVKQVFPNWQRDLEFLRDQPAEEIKMALDAMNDAQAEADAMVINNNEQHDREGYRARMSPRHVTKESDTLSGREEQRLACKFMAQVMKQLIVEKRQRPCNDEAMQQQQTNMNLVGSEAEDCQQLELQSVIDVSENEVDEELYNRSRQEQLPKAVPANGDDIVQCDA
ncbi:hypothetical protein KXD40_002706 [Peronospora effusa]|nr:hypothetical protein KXD40_002706 [Peronospora effusa]